MDTQDIKAFGQQHMQQHMTDLQHQMRFASTCSLTSPKHARENQAPPRKYLHRITQTNSFGYGSSKT